MHKDYEGRLSLCYYATGLQEGGHHDCYACFNISNEGKREKQMPKIYCPNPWAVHVLEI